MKNFCILPLVIISIAFAVLSLYAGKSFFDEVMVDFGEGVGFIAAIIVGIIGLYLGSWPGGLIGALLGYFIISWFCRKFGFLFPWVMVAYCWYLAYQAYHMVKNEFVKDVDPDDLLCHQFLDMNDFTWIYWNREIFELDAVMIDIASDIRRFEGKKGIVEEWMEKQGIESYTISTDGTMTNSKGEKIAKIKPSSKFKVVKNTQK